MNRRWVKFALAGLAIAAFLYAGRNCFDELYRIADARLLGVLGIAVVHLLTLAVQGMTLKYGLEAFHEPISDKEALSLSVFSSYANLLLPRAGIGAIAVYLKNVRKTGFADFGSVILYNAALFVFAASTVGAAVFALDWRLTGNQPVIWLIIGLPTLVIVSAFAVVGVRWTVFQTYRGLGAPFLGRLSRASKRVADFGNVWRIGLLHFTMLFLRALRLQLAFWALGIDVHFSAVLMASVLGDLSFVISVTPMALGFREAAITFVAAKLGTSTSLALSTAIFDRLVFSLTVILVAQVLLALYLRNRATVPSTLRKVNQLEN